MESQIKKMHLHLQIRLRFLFTLSFIIHLNQMSRAEVNVTKIHFEICRVKIQIFKNTP